MILKLTRKICRSIWKVFALKKQDLTYEDWLRLEYRGEHMRTNWKNHIRFRRGETK